jgi:hypothetical protein
MSNGELMPYYNDLRHDDDPLRRGYELVFPQLICEAYVVSGFRTVG